MEEKPEEEKKYNATENFEDYADGVLSYRQKMREVADVLEEYAHNVERFKQGELEQEDMLRELDYVSRQLVELDLEELDMKDLNPEFKPEKGVVSQLTEAELTRMKLEEADSIDIEARDLAMGGLTSIEDRLTVLSGKVVEEMTGYESDFLEEELDTSLEEEYSGLLSEVNSRISWKRALSDGFREMLENPRDRHSPYVRDDGTESLEEAREKVRSEGPRDPLSDEHSPADFEDRNPRYIH